MDRISGLPDELLIKILLLVPTKVAVSTSILSKRWEYLWMWLPKLDYGGGKDCSKSECQKLQCFLDMNLPLHRAPVIERFRIELDNSIFEPKSIKMWVLTTVSHCVRELEISCGGYSAGISILLPSNLFTCNSLVVLRLCSRRILLDVPRMVSLPCLKTLKLESVKYFKDGTLQRLLSNCPILEDLNVILESPHSTRKLSIVVPSLQRLSLYLPNCLKIIDGVVIETPSLKYFKLKDDNYKGHGPHGCLIENMPFLVEAYLDVYHPMSIIGSITSVKRLVICAKTILDEGIVFNQLEHLEVCICGDQSSNQLVRLLKSCSNLRGLHIFHMDCHMYDGMGYWNQPSTVPECMLSSLQSLSWLKYKGKSQEREIVVYILKHALHLKTATITSSECEELSKFDMLKELELSSKASAACQLMFE